MTEIIAAIAGALVAGIFAFITTRWDDISSYFQSKPRNIAGKWKGVSYMMHNGFFIDSSDDPSREPEIHYNVTLNQKGKKITGVLEMTSVTGEGKRLYDHSYKGFVKGEYFIYTLEATGEGQFRLSTALLHILNDGEMMRGYYVANSGRKDPGKTTVGYTIMSKVNK